MGQRGVIKADQTFQGVLQFQPRPLEATAPEAMDELVRASDYNNDFQIAQVVKDFTGLAEVEIRKMESEVNLRALKEVQGIQEQAYQEAYELGLLEGRQKAFVEKSVEIEERLTQLNALIKSFKDAKVHMLNSNENQLMKMVYFLATKMAMHEIAENANSVIQSVLRECVNLSHSNEIMKVSISPDQFEFLVALQKEGNRELEFLKNVEFTAQEGIRSGGCVITTNYSEVDARIEERVSKLWEEFKGALPVLKERVEHD